MECATASKSGTSGSSHRPHTEWEKCCKTNNFHLDCWKLESLVQNATPWVPSSQSGPIKEPKTNEGNRGSSSNPRKTPVGTETSSSNVREPESRREASASTTAPSMTASSNQAAGELSDIQWFLKLRLLQESSLTNCARHPSLHRIWKFTIVAHFLSGAYRRLDIVRC